MNFKLKLAGVFAGVSGVLALTSAISTENVPLEVGNQAPRISAVNASGEVISLSDLKGSEVILNFWSVSDAESRINNVRLERMAGCDSIRYIGVCIDNDNQLAMEVIKSDMLDADTQCFADKSIIDEYQIERGVRTVKIDPYGIVAKID